MSYLSQEEMNSLQFKSLGRNVRISSKASIYNADFIEIGDNSRIDDFCVISGKLIIGRNVHIAVYNNLAGGELGICLDDFSGLAYGCHIFSQSDDYSGRTLTNPTVPDQFKDERKGAVRICRHVIVGACTIVLPGVTINEGSAIGAMSMVTKSTEAWAIYFGIPAKKIKKRHKDLLKLEEMYLSIEN